MTDTNICTVQSRGLARWSHISYSSLLALHSFVCDVKHTQMLV